MYRILFVCYGNICRSPMAEMIFKDLVYQNNKRYMFSCASRATSMEELGNDMYPAAKKVLMDNDITIEKHEARQIKRSDYDNYDYIIVMEERNKKDVLRILGEDPFDKVHLIMEYTDRVCDIEDPWYTGNFEKVYQQIYSGCLGLYDTLLEKKGLDGKQI